MQEITSVIHPVMERLGLTAPRAGSERTWPGLPAGLLAFREQLGIEEDPGAIGFLGAGIVRRSWSGGDSRLAYYVSSANPEHLRTQMLAHILRSHSGARGMLKKGSEEIGDGSYAMGPAYLFFTRGNLGVAVMDDREDSAALDIARRIDRTILAEKPLEPGTLNAHLPKVAKLLATRTELRPGETVRIELQAHPDWEGKVRPYFDYNPARFNTEVCDGPTLELMATSGGKTQVIGCAVDVNTLLCGYKALEITILPGEMPPEEEEDVESDED